MHRSVLLFTFFLFTFNFPSAALAASLRGTVVDPDGGAVPDAQVLVIARGAVVATTTTDARGAFEATGLAADRYELLVARDGFRAAPLAVDLAADDDRSLTVTLQISAVSESLVV